MKKRFNINLDDSAFTKERIPPKPQFQPSSKGGSSTSTAATTKPVQSVAQPLSYAEYIVQSKSNVAAASKPPRSEDVEVTGVRQSEPASVSPTTGKCEALQDLAKGPQVKETQVTGQKSEPGISLGPKPVGSGSSIIVSPRQRGNPILKFVRSVPWEFGDVVPDYVLGQTTCALFLSLRYHNLNPNYIHDRLKQLGHTFTLRVLLVQVDVGHILCCGHIWLMLETILEAFKRVNTKNREINYLYMSVDLLVNYNSSQKDPHHALKELARICIMADCTLILAWSPEEAGRYLETYKSYEKKPADILKEQVEKDYLSKVTDCLTTVKSVNKTDSITLLSAFSSVEGIISASKEDLVLCPGLGPQKAKRLFDVLHKPFLKSKTKDS